jgi:hypothetical protein
MQIITAASAYGPEAPQLLSVATLSIPVHHLVCPLHMFYEVGWA